MKLWRRGVAVRLEGEARTPHPLNFKWNLSEDLLVLELRRVLQVLGNGKLQISFRLK